MKGIMVTWVLVSFCAMERLVGKNGAQKLFKPENKANSHLFVGLPLANGSVRSNAFVRTYNAYIRLLLTSINDSHLLSTSSPSSLHSIGYEPAHLLRADPPPEQLRKMAPNYEAILG